MYGRGIDIKDYLIKLVGDWALINCFGLRNMGKPEEGGAGFFYKQDDVAKSPGKAHEPGASNHCASTVWEVALSFRYRAPFRLSSDRVPDWLTAP